MILKNIDNYNKNQEDNNQNEKKIKNRIYELDILRGIALIAVMIDHLLLFIYLGSFENIFIDYPGGSYLTSKLYYLSKLFWKSNFIEYCAWIFRAIFILDVGICFVLSRNNLKRGIKIGLVALFITLCTIIYSYLFKDRDLIVINGILHVLSLAILICVPLYKHIKNKYFYLISSIIIFIIGDYIFLNSKWYFVDYVTFDLKFIFGILIGKNLIGHDSFSPLLILSGVLMGIFLGKHFYEERGYKSLFNLEYKKNIITHFADNSIWYFLFSRIGYQIVIFLILFICGFKLR